MPINWLRSDVDNVNAHRDRDRDRDCDRDRDRDRDRDLFILILVIRSVWNETAGRKGLCISSLYLHPALPPR